MFEFIDKHGEKIHWILAGVQVTLSQVALWDFLPPKVCAVMAGIAGLCSAWSLIVGQIIKRRDAKEANETQEGV